MGFLTTYCDIFQVMDFSKAMLLPFHLSEGIKAWRLLERLKQRLEAAQLTSLCLKLSTFVDLTAWRLKDIRYNLCVLEGEKVDFCGCLLVSVTVSHGFSMYITFSPFYYYTTPGIFTQGSM